MRPAQIGAALGGAEAPLQQALEKFGSIVGRAFQLRDDILGSFGDPAVTGKPYGGDLQEGKRTVLVLKALAAADLDTAAELSELLGTPMLSESDVARAAEIIEATGARAEVEQIIESSTDQALNILRDTAMTTEGRAGLTELVLRSVNRVH